MRTQISRAKLPRIGRFCRDSFDEPSEVQKTGCRRPADFSATGATDRVPPVVKCGGCGADTDGLVCVFCGRTTRRLLTLDDEQEALLELHDAAQKITDPEAKSRLFTSAWIPSHRELLVEAGLQCLPLIENGQPLDRPVVQRLEAIAARLRVHGDSTPVIERALEEFDAKVERFEKASRNFGIGLLAAVLFVLGLGLLVGWTIFQAIVRR